MKMAKIFSLALLIMLLVFAGCKPKDADIQKAIAEKLAANPEFSGLTSDVKEGVATISGEVKDEATKASVEETVKNVKGVKSVVNNTNLPAPPPVVEEPKVDPLAQGLTDAVKDLPSVHGELKDSVILLTGEIQKKELPKLMKMLHSLHPKKIENKLTVK